ncbi:phosphoribosylaminoimidazole-succinocarboxamide synthase, partial [Tremellales sp. Uapishka_1]
MADLDFTVASDAAAPSIKLSSEAEAKYERITRSLQEVTSGEVIRKVLSEERVVKAYWGTATTGRPHIAYCVPLIKIADFLTAGVHVKVLLAVGLRHRAELMARFHALVTNKAAEHAGADVVKESDSPLMSSLLYPGLQSLDEQYLDVDFQFGGVDQRKIFMYAAHYLPKLGYSKRAHLMNAMVPGLSGGKMSSSDPKSKIDFLDTPAEIKSKLKSAICTPGVVEGNGVLAFLKTVLIPVQELWEEQAREKGQATSRGEETFVTANAPEGTVFSIARPEKYGGDIHYGSYQGMEAAYAKEELHPLDLKNGVTDALVTLLSPIRAAFDADPEWNEAERLAYPDTTPAAVPAKTKAPKAERSNKPPTEEERAVLKAKKDAEKKAKADAKAAAEGIRPAALEQSSKEAAQVEPVASGSLVVKDTLMPKLKLLAKGKVRDIYALPDEKDSDKLLFVATDRISAFDVIMENLEGRSMVVRKCEVVKIEAIVRGYITGSAWSEYTKKGTVHGIEMPKGLVESEKLAKPIFTPSTKADLGDHDENIHPDKAKEICGAEIAEQIETTAIRLYTEAAEYALERGLILADTKFEFGLLTTPSSPKPTLILIDELLTPDSSRYWSAASYTKGQPQASFDKQYLRDWLISNGLKYEDGVALPEDVVRETKKKYEEAKDRVMGLGPFGVHGRKEVGAGDEVALQTDAVADAIEVEAKKL